MRERRHYSLADLVLKRCQHQLDLVHGVFIGLGVARLLRANDQAQLFGFHAGLVHHVAVEFEQRCGFSRSFAKQHLCRHITVSAFFVAFQSSDRTGHDGFTTQKLAVGCTRLHTHGLNAVFVGADLLDQFGVGAGVHIGAAADGLERHIERAGVFGTDTKLLRQAHHLSCQFVAGVNRFFEECTAGHHTGQQYELLLYVCKNVLHFFKARVNFTGRVF